MSGLLPQYKIDNSVIDKYAIQSMISQSQNALKSTTIAQVFSLCDKLIEYDQDQSDKSLKVQIKQIIDQKLTNKQMEKERDESLSVYKIDLQKMYPLNKPGNFGRVLERKCRLVPKGVMEYEQGKQAKLKEVKSFINKVQHIQNKELADLAWINTQPQKFKFRIILLDTNQNKKGVYFETLDEAQNLRAYLVSRYTKTQLNQQVFGALKYSLLEAKAQGLADQIKYNRQMIRLRKEQEEKQRLFKQNTSKIMQNKFKQAQDPANSSNGKIDPLLSSQSKNPQQSLPDPMIKIPGKPKKSFMTGFLDDLINLHHDQSQIHEKEPLKLSQKTLLNLEKLNQAYQSQFFIHWKNAVLLYQNNEGPYNVTSKFPFDQERNQNLQTKKSTKLAHDQSNGSRLRNQDNPARFLSPGYNDLMKNQSSIKQREADVPSPIKQSNRSEKMLSHSRKQQSIFAFPSRIAEEDDEEHEQNVSKKAGTQRIFFKSIEFLQPLSRNPGKNDQIHPVNESQAKGATNPTKNILLIKPIVAITVYKRNLKEENHKGQKDKTELQRSYRSRAHEKRQELVFNTIVKKAFRSSQYELTPAEGDGVYETKEDLNSINLVVSVSNFLTNQELCETEIQFQDYCFSSYSNTIVDKNSLVRLKFEYKNTGVASPEVVYQKSTYSESSLFFSFPKLDPEIIHKIKTYWQAEAVSNSYYNLEDNFSLFDAVTNSANEAEPANWWLDLDETEYNYLCILQSSSIIVGYKLVKPMLHIIRAVKHIHFKIEKIIEMLLSIILNLGSAYYFSKELEQVNYLHREVGLAKGSIPFENRVLLEVLLFDRFLVFECPLLDQKLQSKNISVSHLMLQYTYELFSRNFSIQVLCEFWNYCCEEVIKIPLIFFLTTIALAKLLTDKLLKCNRLSEVKEVFESKQIKAPSLLLNQIRYLRNKYFFKGEGFIEQIKQAFEQKPFEQVLRTYSRKIAEKEESDKKQKTKYKRDLSLKLQDVTSPEQALEFLIKKTSGRKYILHIYFYQLPLFDGKMIIVSGKNQYESLGQQKNRYFIIGQLTSQVILKYNDWKGNCYSGELTFIQGFNEFKLKIYSERRQKSADIHYLAGLLTETQIDIIKTNKKFSHFMAPNITVQLFKDQLLKPARDLRHISGQDWTSQNWFKDLKNIFSYGNKLFNEINYFMHILQVEPISPQQKILKIQNYSLSLSKQFFLCQNEIIFKHLLFEFYKMSFSSIKEQDFQCYFNDALQNQFQAPKIIKCRFYCENREIKLQKQLIQYHSKKATGFLYGDLSIEQIVTFCEKHIRGKTSSTATQGELKILFSTFGEIQIKVIPIRMEGKAFTIEREKYIDNQSIFHELSQKQPEILMTEILPSFAKISTILDYVNSNRAIDLRQKTNQTQRKLIPESINLLQFAQQKFRNCILLRYNKFPQQVQVPFYSYFCELTSEIEKPAFKFYYINNVKDSIKSVCLTKENLKCSTNNKEQDKDFVKRLGLYGNLRRVIREAGTKVNTVFFWTDHKDDNFFPNSLICVNYGYGISRWQVCTIRKYKKKIKERLNRKGLQGENKGKVKIEYLVEKGNISYFARDYEVKINPMVKEQLTLHKEEAEQKFEEVDNDIKKGFSFLMNPNNLRDFVKSVKEKQ